MKICIPRIFYEQKKFNPLMIDDISLVNYKVYSSDEKVYAYSKTNILIFVLRGKKKIKFPNLEVLISDGELIFVKKGSYIMNQIIDLDEGRFESLVICLSDDFIGEFAQTYKSILEMESAHRSDVSDSYFKYNVSEIVKKEVESILLHFASNQVYYKEILKLKIYEILLNLINNDKSLYSIFEDLSKKRKFDLRTHMEENYDKHFSIEEHAQNIGMSMTSFKRNFSKIFNDTPNSWINKKRIEKAAFLLESTKYSITEIAFLVGFENLSHFIKLFKNTYGLTPGRYRVDINLVPDNKKLALLNK